MLNNINLNYKEMWGDQKCIFLVSKQGSLREGEEEGGEEEEEGDQAKVWMLDFGMNFVWNS